MNPKHVASPETLAANPVVKIGDQSYTVNLPTETVFAHVMSAPKGTGYCVRFRRLGPNGAQARAALALAQAV